MGGRGETLGKEGVGTGGKGIGGRLDEERNMDAWRWRKRKMGSQE